MKYDSMTREHAIELLRDIMEALDGLDESLLADQNVARTAAMSALGVDHEPSPLPVKAVDDLDHHQAHTHEVALRIIRGNDQARRVIRLVQWRPFGTRRSFMSAQLSLLDAPIVHADTGDDHQWLPGDDAMSDISAVLSYIPGIGHANGTYRERVYRPLACLYVRTELLDDDTRKVAQSMARTCTGFVDDWNGYDSDRHGEIWLRLNGETVGMGREAVRPVRASDRDAVWWLEFRHGEHAWGKVKHWIDGVRPGLRALGCPPKSKGHSIRLPTLAPLILALRWSPAVEAAVFLAGSGVEPKSGEWAILVDLALSRGLPWSVPLAELSARHPRDVMSRAIGWVHAQGIERRAGR